MTTQICFLSLCDVGNYIFSEAVKPFFSIRITPFRKFFRPPINLTMCFWALAHS